MRKIKIASFLLGAEEAKMKKFKKRKDIEIVGTYHTWEFEIFCICHIEYVELKGE